jgi:hypothetical protein
MDDRIQHKLRCLDRDWFKTSTGSPPKQRRTASNEVSLELLLAARSCTHRAAQRPSNVSRYLSKIECSMSYRPFFVGAKPQRSPDHRLKGFTFCVVRIGAEGLIRPLHAIQRSASPDSVKPLFFSKGVTGGGPSGLRRSRRILYGRSILKRSGRRTEEQIANHGRQLVRG